MAALVLAASALPLGARSSAAAEITDVATAFEDDNPFDLRARIGYEHDEARGAIKREAEVPGSSELQVLKDLTYARSRDAMSARLEAGIFHELGVFVELPFVLDDQTELHYDQSLGSGCVYPGGTGTPNCVNASNSSTVRDGIAPKNGYDAGAAGGPTSGNLLFRGAPRGGSGLDAFDTINVGINWAVLSQRRDPTKPTWVLGFESDISFGNIMKFDRAHPDANHGVSEGLHRLIFRTAVSRRWKWVEPYAGLWYQLPIARADSLFVDYGPAERNQGPQQSAGTVFGLEGIPWERPKEQYKLTLDARLRIEGMFDGRGCSEVWEMLASSPALSCDPTQNPACDPKQTSNPNTKYQGQPYTGLTQIENYASFGADFSVAAQLGRYVRLNLGFQYTHNQAHTITADDVGQSFDPNSGSGCSTPTTGRVTRPCEYNPAYRPIVNQVGRRYVVDGLDLFRVGLWAQAMF